jgi:YVTN family beta-propeller protein
MIPTRDTVRHRGGAALLALALAGCAATSNPPPTSDIGATPAAQPTATAEGLLYVCNQDDASVAVIDIATRRVVRTVDLQALGFSANARPHHIAIEPDGSHWYVSLIGEGRVVKLDRADRVVASAPFETPGMLALEPDGHLLFVGRSMTAVNPPPRLGMIDRRDMSIDEVDVLFPRPHALALDDATGTAYTASLGVNRIAAVDTRTGRATLTDVEGPPHALMQFAVSPDGRTLAISGEISHTVHFFDIAADRLRPRHLSAVSVAAQPFDPIFSADGATLWLGNKAANRITAIDVATRAVVTVLDDARIREPHGAARSPDGRFIFISSTNVREDHAMHGGAHAGHAAAPVRGGRGNVVVIDAATHAIVDVIEVGNNATGIAVVR